MTCNGCLQESTEAFCRACAQSLFQGQQVAPTLPFNSPMVPALAHDWHTFKISLSGVQPKYALQLANGALVPTQSQGAFMLKPNPPGPFQLPDQVAANEHLTMLVARQVFGVVTPPGALLHFNNGAPAYLVKRFDRLASGLKTLQEDFAQLAQVSAPTHGPTYKYDLSYEALGQLMRRLLPEPQKALQHLFRRVVFNYALGNGDAHLKNFAVQMHANGQYRLTPAYDLLCTKLHTPFEHDLALDLLEGNFTPAYLAHGFYTSHDFMVLARQLGLEAVQARAIMGPFQVVQPEVAALVRRSFLSAPARQQYLEVYQARTRRLQIEWEEG